MRILILLLLAAGALALPLTPHVYVNRKLTLAQVGDKGRIYVDFDVRSVGGQGLEIRLWKPGQRPVEDKPFRTWTFGAQGHERLNFNDLPRGIYRLVGVALGPGGEPMAEPSVLVHIEYGGARAWDTFLPPPNRDLRADGPPFENVETGGGREAPGLTLTPVSLLLNPKEEAEITATLESPPDATEDLEWELIGEGELEPKGFKAIYRAPDESPGNKVSQIRVRVRQRPQVRAMVGVLITEMKKEELQKK